MEPAQNYPTSPEMIGYQSRGVARSPVPRIAALVAIVMLGIVAIADLVFSISTFMQINLIEDVKAHGLRSMAAVEANDTRQFSIFLVWATMLGVCAITFMVWMFKAHRILRQLGASHLNHSSGGTIGWWFCPIANLWMPCKVMAEIYSNSDPMGRRGTGALLGLWWALFIIQGVVWRVGNAVTSAPLHEQPTADQLINASWLIIIASVPHILGAVAAMALIRKINDNQQQRWLMIANQEINGASANNFNNPYSRPLGY